MEDSVDADPVVEKKAEPTPKVPRPLGGLLTPRVCFLEPKKSEKRHAPDNPQEAAKKVPRRSSAPRISRASAAHAGKSGAPGAGHRGGADRSGAELLTPAARPFIKFVGGKHALVPELLKRMPKAYNTYHECFLGGGALFFALGRPAEISDINTRLIRTYQAIQTDVEAVIQILHTMVYDKEYYLRVRASNPETFDDAGCAAWFIYLNKTGFNGLYRVNKSGQFNVPFGRYTNPTICDAANLRACSAALQDSVIRREDFRAIVLRANPGDVCYFDSPYVPLSVTSNFTSYTADGFGFKDQEDLRDVALDLKRRGVHVILSNSGSPLVEQLYGKHFKLEPVSANRAINSKADRRGAVKEYIIT